MLTIDERSWRERLELARMLGAFLPQDHIAAKRLHIHLLRADRTTLAAGAAERLERLADAVLTDDVPQAIEIYSKEGMEAWIGGWRD